MSNWKQQVADFKAGLKISEPRISAQALRFGFFGLTGGGKSVTGGIFAVGITPSGLIGWVDGENERSGWAIDIIADMAAKYYGGTKDDWKARFVVIHVEPPFHPLRVISATEMLEDKGCKTIVLDLLTQCWDSEGGYLDLKEEELDKMAGEDRKQREKSAAAAAAHIKPWTHQKLVNKVNSSKANLVLLFQAKQKFNFAIKRPDDFTTPIQESGLTRTALAVGRVEQRMLNGKPQGGFCTFEGSLQEGVKYTHPALLELLPKNGEQMTFGHAERIAKWCSQGAQTAPAKKPNASSETVRNRALELLTPYGDLVKTFFEQRGWIAPDESINQWPFEKVPKTKEEMRALMAEIETFRDTGTV